MDFLLIGGASLPLLLLPLSGPPWPGTAEILAYWAFYIAFLCNLPHFAYSYLLLYENYAANSFGQNRPLAARLRYLNAGIVIPALMLGFFIYCLALGDRGLLGYAANAMFFFVGWHYAKQGYGVLIVFSALRRIYYAGWQKLILLANIYAVWLLSWLGGNVAGAKADYYGMPYTNLSLPPFYYQGAFYATCILSALTLGVLAWKRFYERKEIPVNGVVGYVTASYVWLLLVSVHPALISFAPFFHSLQYLAFVYKYKQNEWRDTLTEEQRQSFATASTHEKRLLLKRPLQFAALGVALGGAFMYLIPWILDQHLHLASQFGSNIFMFLFLIFINIHHYFIDNAIWRRDNAKVQKYIFAAARSA